MLKKYLLYTTLSVLVLSVFSCSKEQEKTFDNSAAQRIEDSIKEYKEILVGAENGWVLQYYPGESQELGGYNYYLKFKNFNKVEVILESGEKVETEYNLHQNGGVVLSFVTYNERAHFFATPSGSNPSGFQGDFEFLFTSRSEDGNEVNLTGLKYRSAMRLIKIKDSQEAYMTATESKAELLRGSIFGVQKDDAIQELGINIDDRTISIDDKVVSFVFTDEGIHFYEPVTINGITLQDLRLSEDNTKLVSLDGKLSVISKNTLPIDLKTTSILTSYDSVSNVIQTAWNEAADRNAALGDPPSFVLTLNKTFTLGRDLLTILSQSNTGGVYRIQSDLEFKPSFFGDDYITIQYKGTGVINNRSGLYNRFFGSVVDPLLTVLTGTFKITSQQTERGHLYTFVKQDDPTIYFVGLGN